MPAAGRKPILQFSTRAGPTSARVPPGGVDLLPNPRTFESRPEPCPCGGIYFEVDLAEILQHANRDWFKWFYLCFRRESFAASGGCLSDPRGR